MTQISFTRDVSFSVDQMMDLVADVARYPEFVPNCADMELTRLPNREDMLDARMFVQYGPVSGDYTSRVKIDRAAKRISADALDGPFSHLESAWTFIPQDEGSKIRFDIDFAFSNPFLAAVAEPLFAAKQEEIIDAFVQRAVQIYA